MTTSVRANPDVRRSGAARDQAERRAVTLAERIALHSRPEPVYVPCGTHPVSGRPRRRPAWQSLVTTPADSQYSAGLTSRQAGLLARIADTRLKDLTPDAPLDVQLQTLGVQLHVLDLDPDLLGVSIRRRNGLTLIVNAALDRRTQETTLPQLLAQTMFLQPDQGHLACWRHPPASGELWARRKLTSAFAEAFMNLRATRTATRSVHTIRP